MQEWMEQRETGQGGIHLFTTTINPYRVYRENGNPETINTTSMTFHLKNKKYKPNGP